MVGKMLQGIVLLFLHVAVCFGELTIYPHPNGVPRSTKFHVHLSQSGHPRQSSFVYMSTSDHRATEESYVIPQRSISWAPFEFSGSPVTVEVTTAKDFHTCLVRPTHYGFQCYRSARKTAEVVITQNTRMMSIEFDYDFGTSGHSDIVDKLLVFADAPEHDIPQNHQASNILFYGKGVHDLGGQKLIDTHITEVYIARGAYVHGAFKTANNHPGVKIHGRGILSGERYAFHDPKISWALILLDGGGHHIVDGIILMDSTMYFLRALSHNNVVRNIKTVAAWTYNSDGVALGVNGTVEDSFIMANDDSLKIYRDNLVVSRCVVWQSYNGAVFQFGWWTKRVLHHVTVSDIDVIHTDWCAFKKDHCHISNNDNVFALSEGTNHFEMADLEFRNIRIEGVCPRLFNFQVSHNATGSINNVRFVNWTVEQVSTYSNLHSSLTGTSAVPLTNWQFVDFKIHNRCIDSSSQTNLQTDKQTTSLNFHCNGGQIVG